MDVRMAVWFPTCLIEPPFALPTRPASLHNVQYQIRLLWLSCSSFAVQCDMRGSRIIGTTCSAYRSGACNGHVRLKVDGIARFRAVGRRLNTDEEGYAGVVVQDVCGTGLLGNPLS